MDEQLVVPNMSFKIATGRLLCAKNAIYIFCQEMDVLDDNYTLYPRLQHLAAIYSKYVDTGCVVRTAIITGSVAYSLQRSP